MFTIFFFGKNVWNPVKIYKTMLTAFLWLTSTELIVWPLGMKSDGSHVNGNHCKRSKSGVQRKKVLALSSWWTKPLIIINKSKYQNILLPL